MVTASANAGQNVRSGAATGPQSFSAHLQSLRGFGQELQTQLDGVRQPLDQLSQLLRRELPLGGFGEAYALATHHLSMAEQMYSLLQAVRQAVDFSGQVTGQVVASYQRYDQEAAAALADPNLTGPPGVQTLPQTFTYSDPANVSLPGA